MAEWMERQIAIPMPYPSGSSEGEGFAKAIGEIAPEVQAAVLKAGEKFTHQIRCSRNKSSLRWKRLG